jgi:hypothetical protein
MLATEVRELPRRYNDLTNRNYGGRRGQVLWGVPGLTADLDLGGQALVAIEFQSIRRDIGSGTLQ